MLVSALVLEGASFWIRDAVTKDLPARFYYSDLAWIFAFASLAVFRWRPRITVACVWVWVCIAIVLQPPSREPSWGRFLYTHIFEWMGIIFAHVALHFKLAKDKRQLSGGIGNP